MKLSEIFDTDVDSTVDTDEIGNVEHYLKLDDGEDVIFNISNEDCPSALCEKPGSMISYIECYTIYSVGEIDRAKNYRLTGTGSRADALKVMSFAKKLIETEIQGGNIVTFSSLISEKSKTSLYGRMVLAFKNTHDAYEAEIGKTVQWYIFPQGAEYDFDRFMQQENATKYKKL